MRAIFSILFLFLSVQALAGESAIAIYNKHSSNIVKLQGKHGTTGTGFFIAPGVLLSNRHVAFAVFETNNSPTVDEIIKITKSDGTSINSFKHILCSKTVDLCAIYLDESNTVKNYLEISEGEIAPGTDVYIIGHPKNIEIPVLSNGIISSKLIDVPLAFQDGRKASFKAQMTTAPVSPGSSGSPVFLSNGLLVGIVVSQLNNAQNLNIIISAKELIDFAHNVGTSNVKEVFLVTPGLADKINEYNNSPKTSPYVAEVSKERRIENEIAVSDKQNINGLNNSNPILKNDDALIKELEDYLKE